MPRLVRHLEGLYGRMWDAFEQGALPQPDLANLDVYLEIGNTVDHDATEIQSIVDYRGWWLEKLAQRHRFRPIGPDQRLFAESGLASPGRPMLTRPPLRAVMS